MKTISGLAEFWQIYFLEPAQITGIDAWCIVFFAQDKQNLLVSLANPFTEASEEVFITNVSPADTQTFVHHYQGQFLEQLPNRFGFFRLGVDKVLTEYPDWETFYGSWLNDDASLLQGNMPLLFDYPSEQEYRAMQLKQADYAGYRRLLVVLYQYRRRQFQKVFVRAVDQPQYERIKAQTVALFTRALPELLLSGKSTPDA